MSTPTDIFIAGSKTAEDWRLSKPNLVNGDAAVWEAAFDDYFIQRLDLRYLAPIKLLQENDTRQGEGFTIVTVQCSLIEFLESTAEGTTYRWLPRGQTCAQYEYSSSKDAFVAFLSKRVPFTNTFDANSALDFYINVRCGLLHEARTKGGWKIWADGPNSSIADIQNRIVYRNNFQKALLGYIDLYRVDIQSSKALQQAFIRKFDSLCL